MNKAKKFIVAGIAALTIGITSTSALAATASPLDRVAEITGQSIETITAQREAGKTCGQIADEFDKLAEFKEATGKVNCDGTGSGLCDGSGQGAGNGQGNGLCDGSGQGAGNGQGNGLCDGSGQGAGGGHGRGLRDGSCLR